MLIRLVYGVFATPESDNQKEQNRISGINSSGIGYTYQGMWVAENAGVVNSKMVK